jgi:hypothetical protein
MIEKVRRVVMGEPLPGKSVFSHVEAVEPLHPAPGSGELSDRPLSAFWFIWGWDELPQLPHHDTEPFVARSFFPPPGGLRINAVRYVANTVDHGLEASGTAAQMSPSEARGGDGAAEVTRLIRAEPCGMYQDATRPGMHRTDSIDIGVIVSGEITIESDDGSTVVLGPGDVYIQNGAVHNWKSHPENPAHVVFIILPAQRVNHPRAE